jgi:hypothetical protein
MNSLFILAASALALGGSVAMWAGWIKKMPVAQRRPVGGLLLFMALAYVPVLTPPADRTGRWLDVAIATAILAAVAGVVLIAIPGKRASGETFWSSWWERMTSLYGVRVVRRYLMGFLIGFLIQMLGVFSMVAFHDDWLGKRFLWGGLAVMACTVIVSWSYVLYKKLRLYRKTAQGTGASTECADASGDDRR